MAIRDHDDQCLQTTAQCFQNMFSSKSNIGLCQNLGCSFVLVQWDTPMGRHFGEVVLQFLYHRLKHGVASIKGDISNCSHHTLTVGLHWFCTVLRLSH
jgi:hypothetical protein